MSTTNIGNTAENAVATYLTRLGYSVAAQNYKTKYYEIDIVAHRDNVLYFVEVKYRQNLLAGDGFDYITPAKLHHMQRAAEGFVAKHGWIQEYLLMAAAVTGDLKSPDIDLREV
jgi:putative endonuclease